MVVVVKYPITLYVDNVGALFLLDKKLVYKWTKHIDVIHHFIRD